jgi:undecaprenyl diphosphate synthase
MKLDKKELLSKIDKKRLPHHVAIIMDGNGRWAKQRHFPRIEGHRRGIKSVRDTVEGCCEVGVKALTLYAFSLENWQRPASEVSALMRLMEKFLYDEIPEMNENGVRLILTGRTERLPDRVLKAMDVAQKETLSNKKLILNLAFNYGSRTEILDAVNGIIRDIKSGEMLSTEVTEESITERLYAPYLPDPDLLIRTSGEQRISNFLLWQLAYAELWFTEILWPEFRREHLYLAILDFQKRERRFGRVG